MDVRRFRRGGLFRRVLHVHQLDVEDERGAGLDLGFATFDAIGERTGNPEFDFAALGDFLQTLRPGRRSRR